MEEEFITIYTSSSTTQVTKHSSLFAAQRTLLLFVRSLKCKEILASAKDGIRSYLDLASLAFHAAVQGGGAPLLLKNKVKKSHKRFL